MADTALARTWFGLTALAVTVGLVVQVSATLDLTEGFFDQRWERVLNLLVFFTIQSNILVGVGCAALAFGAATTSLGMRSIRLLGVTAIMLTFVVFHAVLRQLQDLTGQAAFADVLLHSVVPLMCVSGWVLFGPRGLVDRRAIVASFLYVVAWGAFTLIRGEIVGFYPYPFVDPTDSGYLRVGVNLVVIGAVFVSLGIGAGRLDRWLAGRGDD